MTPIGTGKGLHAYMYELVSLMSISRKQNPYYINDVLFFILTCPGLQNNKTVLLFLDRSIKLVAFTYMYSKTHPC